MIPRRFHRIWLGDAPMPDEYVRFALRLRDLHPEWEITTWIDETVPKGLRCQEQFDAADNPAMQADILRLELLWRYGGIYLDTDIEPLRPFDPLLPYRAFMGKEDDHYLCNAVIGAEPHHPFVDLLLRELPASFAMEGTVTERTGPMFITRTFRPGDVGRLPVEYFYPVHHTEKEKIRAPSSAKQYPFSYAVHHWAMSWG